MGDAVQQLSTEEIDELLWYEDKDYYLERPVDLYTFLFDDEYLGKVFKDRSGDSTIFEYWLNLLFKVYPSPFYTPYQEVILSCAIGVGKSTITTISMLYELYKMLCLKSPSLYYGLMITDTIVMAIFSSTKENVGDVNWSKMKDAIVISPWFQKRLNLDKAEPKIKSLDISKNIAIQLGSRYQHAIGRDVLVAVVDEGNNKLLTDQVKTNYTEIRRRRLSRFQDGFNVPGILWLISSPKTTDDFLNERIKAAENDSSVLVVDNVPTWVAKKEKMNYSGRVFYVFLGDEQHDPRILTKSENHQAYPVEQVMEVPIEHYKEFQDDILGAIRDVGGKRVQASTALFKSKEVITRAFTLQNIFTKDVVPLSVMDKYEDILSFVDFNILKNKMKVKNKRCLHLDFGFNGDMFGIAATYSAYKDSFKLANASGNYHDSQLQQSYEGTLDRKFIVDWVIGFKAKTKNGVPVNAIVNFIHYLKKIGYPIDMVTADKPGIVVLQELKILGFETEYLSVDVSRIPYLTLQQKLYDGSVVGCKSARLVTEMINLRDDGGSIDHPARFNDGCFTGDTKIICNGSYISLEELASKGADYEFNVIGYDIASNRYICTTAFNAHKTKTAKELLELEFEDGSVIRCTEDHLFLLENGMYKRADELEYKDIIKNYKRTDCNNPIMITRKTKTTKEQDVYDITVPETSNFMLANGCMVHNSTGGKDIADGVAGSFITAFRRPVSVSAESVVDAFLESGIGSAISNTSGLESLF